MALLYLPLDPLVKPFCCLQTCATGYQAANGPAIMGDYPEAECKVSAGCFRHPNLAEI